jgi:hypothetical protein
MTWQQILALIAQIPSVVGLIEQIIAALNAAGPSAESVEALKAHVAKFEFKK